MIVPVVFDREYRSENTIPMPVFGGLIGTPAGTGLIVVLLEFTTDPSANTSCHNHSCGAWFVANSNWYTNK